MVSANRLSCDPATMIAAAETAKTAHSMGGV
jgi:hypothetical protein